MLSKKQKQATAARRQTAAILQQAKALVNNKHVHRQVKRLAIEQIPGGTYVAGSLSKWRRLFGKGDYSTTNKNDIRYNSLIKGNAAIESSFNSGKRGVRVCNREYIGDLVSQGDGFAIMLNHVAQPGLSGSFPWLSNAASAYETYKFHGLVYEFVSTSTNYAATSALGVVVMAAQHRADAPGFSSRLAIENSEHCVSVRPDKNIMYGIECVDSAQNEYFVRSGVTSTPSITEDFVKLTVATAGITAASGTTLGELWVTYDVELFNPKIPISIGGYANIFRGSVTNANPLGTTGQGIYVGGSYVVTVSDSQTIRFGSTGSGLGLGLIGMVYQVVVMWTCSTATAVSHTDSATAVQATITPIDERTGARFFVPSSGAISSRMMFACRLTVTGPNPYLRLSASNTIGAAITNCQILVTPVGPYGPYNYDSEI